MSKSNVVVLLVLLGLTAHGASTAQRTSVNDVTVTAVKAAQAFLGTLDAARRAKANIDLNAKTRTVWSNLPTGITLQSGATERNGLKLGDMTPAQEKAALALVASVLSRDGFQKAMDIVNADQLLETRSAPTRKATSGPRFGRAEFYVAILGTPSATSAWMLQFGGHHLAINVTLEGSRNVLAPTHTGAQPATYTMEGRTVRPLGDEDDKAFALMNALSADQQKQALLGYDVRNLVLGPGADGKTIQAEGIRGSALSAAQGAMLLDLVSEWVSIIGPEAGAAKMAEVKAGLSETYFAWAGSTTKGEPAYFRVQGPNVFIEYAPQGSGPASTEHIHTIYRDPEGDYGERVR
jgi:hypothetical protein